MTGAEIKSQGSRAASGIDRADLPASVRALLQQAEKGDLVVIDHRGLEAYTLSDQGRTTAKASYVVAARHMDAVKAATRKIMTVGTERRRSAVKVSTGKSTEPRRARPRPDPTVLPGGLLTSRQAAAEIGITLNTFCARVRRWADAGRITRQRTADGRAFAYSNDDKLAALASDFRNRRRR